MTRIRPQHRNNRFSHLLRHVFVCFVFTSLIVFSPVSRVEAYSISGSVPRLFLEDVSRMYEASYAKISSSTKAVKSLAVSSVSSFRPNQAAQTTQINQVAAVGNVNMTAAIANVVPDSVNSLAKTLNCKINIAFGIELPAACQPAVAVATSTVTIAVSNTTKTVAKAPVAPAPVRNVPPAPVVLNNYYSTTVSRDSSVVSSSGSFSAQLAALRTELLNQISRQSTANIEHLSMSSNTSSGGSSSATITVPGADGDVLFSTGSELDAVSDFHYDSATTRLGVGTSTPTHTLTVGGSINFTGTLYNNGSVVSFGSGLTSLNGQTEGTQTFATSSDTNIALHVTSTGGVHTFTPAWTGTLAASRGGTGISSISANGILVGNAGGTGWTQIATTSLGLLTTNVTEGSNQYFTNARARTAISETVTGIDYDNSSGVISLTSGYVLPLSASTTEWAAASASSTLFSGFYLTPSTRITAGTNLAWSGNTLNISTTTSLGLTTSDITEGSRLYFTDARADARIAATTSLPNITSLPGLTTAGGLVTVGALTSGSIGSGFGSINIGSSDFAAGNATTSKIVTANATIGSGTGVLRSIDGVVSNIATTSLGLLTTNVAEGSNQYFTDDRARAAVSETITGVDYASGVFSLTAGYVIPLTASTSEWVAAAASTTALTPSYLRNLFSTSATGLTYNSSTGATTLTAGYVIPLTASTSDWTSFFDTPSTRITAGTNLAWSGNTLNISTTTSLGLTTSDITEGSRLYFTDARGRGAVSEIITGVDYDNSSGVFSLTAGYVLSLSASTTEWAAAAASTTALTPVYLRNLFSNSATGLSYNSTTGATALVAGYSIPLTASTSEWAAASASTTALTPAYIRGLSSNSATGLTYNSSTGATTLTAGYVIPLVASSTEWASAYASTTALTPTYFRNLFSNSSTGLTYDSSTGALSLTSGYGIPLTASTTEWAAASASSTLFSGFYLTPSTRITAGPGLSWSGNTLNTSANAAFTLGSGFIYNATTSDMVGIGSSTPTATLAIQGSATAPTRDLLAIASSSSAQYLTVKSSGNVGIGTASPSAKLHVTGLRSNNTARILVTDETGAIARLNADGYNNGTDAAANLFLSGDGDQAIKMVSGGVSSAITANTSSLILTNGSYGITIAGSVASTTVSGKFTINASGSANFTPLTITANDSLATNVISIGKSSSAGSYLLMNSSGNLGIGTTSPSEKLSVAGNALIDGVVTASNFVATSTTKSTFPLASTTALTVGSTAYFPSGIWNSSGNVGIGTVSPNEKLDVNGAIQFRSVTSGYATTQSVGMLDFANAGARFLSFGADASTKGIFSWYQAGQNNASGAEVMRIAANGSMSLGTTGSVAKMNIKNDIASYSGLAIEHNALPYSGTSALLITSTVLGDASTYNLISAANLTSNKFVVRGDGNVGIGTTTPSEKLSVVGNALIGGTVTASNFVGTSTTATSTFYNASTTNLQVLGKLYDADNSGGTIGDILINTGTSQTWRATSTLGVAISDTTGVLSIARGGTNNSSAYTTGSVVFSDGTSLTQNNSDFFWDNTNSRLGIGITAPAQAFEISKNVAGSYTDSSNIRLSYSTQPTVYYNDIQSFFSGNTSENGINFSIAGGGGSTIDALTLTQDAKVKFNGGLGYGDSFEVKGAVGSVGSFAIANNDFVQASAGTSLRVVPGAATGNTYYAINVSTNGNNNSGDLILNSSVGNVGIGTTTPSEKLSVAGNALIDGVVTASNFVATSTTKSTFPLASTTALTVGSTAYFPGSGVWNSSGNVGIGTASPGARLDVVSSTTSTFGLRVYGGSTTGTANAASGEIKLGNHATDYGLLTYNGQNGLVYLDAHYSGGAVNLSVAGTSLFSVLSTGSKGIAASSSSYGLVVTGGSSVETQASSGEIRLGTDATDHGLLAYGGSTGDLFLKNNYSAGRIHIQNSAGEPMTILTNGNIGLGETAPGSKLSVSGGGTFGASYDTTAAPTNGLLVEGSVGIGTTSPSQTLAVVGSAQITTGLGVGIVETTAGRITSNTGFNATSNASTSIMLLNGTSIMRVIGGVNSTYPNVFFGPGAGNNSVGNGAYENTGLGLNSLNVLTTGDYNSAVGSGSLSLNQGGNYNSAFGKAALGSNVSGSYNTGVGHNSLGGNTADGNTAIGYDAGSGNSSGTYNIALGYSAYGTTYGTTGSGVSNIAIGSASSGYHGPLSGASSGSYNIALGTHVLIGNTSGGYNIGQGFGALSANTSGSYNIALGYLAGNTITTGSKNILIGYNVDVLSASDSFYMNIGDIIYGTSTNGSAITQIGIGSSTPSAKLTVTNALSGNSFIVEDQASDTSPFVIDASGNVGVGSTTPVTTLSVAGSAIITTGLGVGKLNTTAGTVDVAGTGAYRFNGQSVLQASSTLQNYYFGYLATAGNSTMTGTKNLIFSASGGNALSANTTGSSNIAFSNHWSPLPLNTTGGSNISMGDLSLYQNTTGSSNTAIGYYTLGLNVDGAGGIAIGPYALSAATSSDYSVAIGYSAQSAMGGYENIALGRLAMNGVSAASSTGYGNFAVGGRTLKALTSGIANIAIGTDYGVNDYPTAGSLSTGSHNIIFGKTAGTSIATSSYNIIQGYDAGSPLLGGDGNLMLGAFSGRGGADLAWGNYNSFIGYSSGSSNTSQSYSTALGYAAVVGCSDCIVLGRTTIAGVGIGSTTPSAKLTVTNASSTNSFTVEDQASDTSPFVIDASGNVGVGSTTPSDKLSVVGSINATGNINVAAGSSYKYNGTAFIIASTTLANYFFGSNSGNFTATGISNTGIGASTLGGVTTGNYNAALGTAAGSGLTTGSSNSAIGFSAMSNMNTGSYNTALGDRALNSATSSSYNIAIGYLAMGSATQSGSRNMAMGYGSLYSNTSGNDNIAFGGSVNSSAALTGNTTGSGNVAVGGSASGLGFAYGALRTNTTGSMNTALGVAAGAYSTTGSYNTFLGAGTGGGFDHGDGNTLVGYGAATLLAGDSYFLNIANIIYGTSTNSNGLIGIGSSTPTAKLTVRNTTASNSFFVEDVANDTTPFVIDTSGNVGIGTSSPSQTLAVVGSTQVTVGLGVGKVNTTANTVDIATGGSYRINATRLATGVTANYSYFFGEAGNPTIGNVTGIGNNGFGSGALYSVTSGQQNVAMGVNSALNLTTGIHNIAMGRDALFTTTDGQYNVALGYHALRSNTDGDYNVAIGHQAGRANTTGYGGVFLGYSAGDANTTGANNTAIGTTALAANTTGQYNMAIGYQALNGIIGDGNTAFGSIAGGLNTSGNYNTYIGYNAAINQTSGSQNIIIGYNINAASSTGSNQLNIGNIIFGTGITGTNNTIAGNIGIGTTTPSEKLVVAGNIQSTALLGGATTLSTDVNGNIIRTPSDRNLKTNIAPITGALDKVTRLQGVSYDFNNKDFGAGSQIGFIAQDVAEIFPEVVSTGGEYVSLNYSNLVAAVVEAVKELDVNIKAVEASIASKISIALAELGLTIENGILTAKDFIAGTITAKDKVCIGNTCITEAELQRLIANANASQATSTTTTTTTTTTTSTSGTTSGTGGGTTTGNTTSGITDGTTTTTATTTTSTATSTPETSTSATSTPSTSEGTSGGSTTPAPESTPTPEPTPEVTPEPTSTTTPEPTPEPAPAPAPAPEPAPAPAPEPAPAPAPEPTPTP